MPFEATIMTVEIPHDLLQQGESYWLYIERPKQDDNAQWIYPDTTIHFAVNPSHRLYPEPIPASDYRVAPIELGNFAQGEAILILPETKQGSSVLLIDNVSMPVGKYLIEYRNGAARFNLKPPPAVNRYIRFLQHNRVNLGQRVPLRRGQNAGRTLDLRPVGQSGVINDIITPKIVLSHAG